MKQERTTYIITLPQVMQKLDAWGITAVLTTVWAKLSTWGRGGEKYTRHSKKSSCYPGILGLPVERDALHVKQK